MTDVYQEINRFAGVTIVSYDIPHPIFFRLADLRNTFRPSRKVEGEIDRIEAMLDASQQETIRNDTSF